LIDNPVNVQNISSNESYTHDRSHSKEKLKCAFINVCGLCSKLNNPDFVSFVNDYDIVNFSETKLDCYDRPHIDGYTFIGKNRDICKNKSGGVGLFVRSHLSDNIAVLEMSNENCLWYKFKSSDSIFATIYIPPEGSLYGSIDIFEKIENDINNIMSVYDNSSFILFGDFNAKTGKLSDLLIYDPFIVDNTGIDDRLDDLPVQQLLNLGIPVDRYTEDGSAVNNYGRRLIEMCKNTNLCIVNGRCDKDLYIGRNTCSNKSLIDYVIASPGLLAEIDEFLINDFDPIYSDVHSCIKLRMGCKELCNHDDNNSLHQDQDFDSSMHESRQCPIWDTSARGNFSNCLNNDKMVELQVLMDDVWECKDYSDSCIDNLTERVSELLVNAADQCNLMSKKTIHKPNQNCLGLTRIVTMLGKNI